MQLKRLVTFLMALAILLGSCAAVVAQEVTLTDEQLDAINAALEDDSKDLPIGEEFRITISANDLSVVQGLDEDWMHILLLGTDTGNIKLNYGRTDAMLVLSVNTESGQMKLTSLIRDMYVEIPQLKHLNRINTANAFGGPNLAMKTVNETLGLNITKYCSINFSGFREIVDYLGGVTLTLSPGEANEVGVRASTDPQALNGEQALKYVRIRSLDNNFGRNERQRLFLASLLDKVKSSSFDQMMGAITAGFKAIATNLTTNEVIALLPTVVRNTEEIQMLSLPQEGAYKFITTDWNAAVVEFDKEAVKNAFHSFVYGADTKE